MYTDDVVGATKLLHGSGSIYIIGNFAASVGNILSLRLILTIQQSSLMLHRAQEQIMVSLASQWTSNVYPDIHY